jgi:hypothetical protein
MLKDDILNMKSAAAAVGTQKSSWKKKKIHFSRAHIEIGWQQKKKKFGWRGL